MGNTTFSGAQSSDFSITPTYSQKTVAGMDSLVWTVTFTPSDTGRREALLMIDVSYRDAPEMVQLSGWGSLTPVGIAARGPASGFFVGRNYPNPVGSGGGALSQTIIPYRLSQPSAVRITVYNELGRMIETLVDRAQDPGEYAVVWNAAGRAPGMYTCRFDVAGSGASVRIAVIR
jgi:hypothetical protein